MTGSMSLPRQGVPQLTTYYVRPVLRPGSAIPDFIIKQGIDLEVGLGFESAYDAVLWAKVVQTDPDVIGTEITPDISGTQ